MPNQADTIAMYELKTGSFQSAGRGSERAPGVMMAAQPAYPLHWPIPAPDVPTPLFYWSSLWRWRRWLVGLVFVGAVLGSGAACLRTPTYCARTVLRPVSAPDITPQFSLASSLLGGKSEADSYRYISIITSRQFMFRLLDEHSLTESSEFSSRGWLSARRLDRWGIYRTLKRAMTVEFDRRQGNIVIELTLSNRRLAQDLLGWLIANLREQLRKSELDESEASNRSLEEQARRTPDDIVRQQIYQHIAYELQRAALAKVQADFAFAVIDPPLADDLPADLSPPAVAALAALALLIAGIIAVWSHDYLALVKTAESRASAR